MMCINHIQSNDVSLLTNGHGCEMAHLQKILQDNGYEVLWLHSMNYSGLVDILHKMCLPMLVSCPLEKYKGAYHRIIELCPKICQSDDSSKVII